MRPTRTPSLSSLTVNPVAHSDLHVSTNTETDTLTPQYPQNMNPQNPRSVSLLYNLDFVLWTAASHRTLVQMTLWLLHNSPAFCHDVSVCVCVMSKCVSNSMQLARDKVTVKCNLLF